MRVHGRRTRLEQNPIDPTGQGPVVAPWKKVMHVTHVRHALSILNDAHIRPSLIYEETRLNTTRIHVVWLSPNKRRGLPNFGLVACAARRRVRGSPSSGFALISGTAWSPLRQRLPILERLRRQSRTRVTRAASRTRSHTLMKREQWLPRRPALAQSPTSQTALRSSVRRARPQCHPELHPLLSARADRMRGQVACAIFPGIVRFRHYRYQQSRAACIVSDTCSRTADACCYLATISRNPHIGGRPAGRDGAPWPSRSARWRCARVAGRCPRRAALATGWAIPPVGHRQSVVRIRRPHPARPALGAQAGRTLALRYWCSGDLAETRLRTLYRDVGKPRPLMQSLSPKAAIVV